MTGLYDREGEQAWLLNRYRKATGGLPPELVAKALAWCERHADDEFTEAERDALHAATFEEPTDDMAGYPRLCTTCGGTGHVTSYGGPHGYWDTTCPDCDGHGERAATFEEPER